ncbi:MAG: adenine deaminase [Myxococcota bacterium]|jgi:adenine deaminase
MSQIKTLVEKSMSGGPVDLLIKNANVINVLSGEIHKSSVAVQDGVVIGFGERTSINLIDANGAYLAPGFIDGHIHLESTMLTVPEFARAVVPHGTSAVIADPHEFANVLGIEGIRYLLAKRPGLPLDIHVMLPSCVPATDLETSGARLSSWHLDLLRDKPGVAGLAEMMNYPGVIYGDPEVHAKLALFRDSVIDGHAPGLSGRALDSYILAGPDSDHECTTLEEAREKLRAGMHILLREGSSEKNLHDLLPLVTAVNSGCFSFCSDDRHPPFLLAEGHIDHNVRLAIGSGMDPVMAIKIATINTARHYRLQRTGAIAPGYKADFFMFDNLKDLRPNLVIKGGRIVAENGKSLFDVPDIDRSLLSGTMHAMHAGSGQIAIRAGGKRIRVIAAVPGQIVTRALEIDATLKDGFAVADPGRDLAKLAVIERHRSSGRVGLGFVTGFGIMRGAIASSVGHDSHNLCVLGTNDADMAVAANHVMKMDGGQCAVLDGTVVAEVQLPIAGLVSEKPLEAVAAQVRHLEKTVHETLGCILPDPFAVMSFLPLVPIPELRLTDIGLIDSKAFKLTELFVKHG